MLGAHQRGQRQQHHSAQARLPSAPHQHLRRHSSQLCDFAAGNPVGHWGGRLLWQVDDSKGFVVAWLPTPDEDAFAAERKLMLEFRDIFGVWPLANIQGPRKQA